MIRIGRKPAVNIKLIEHSLRADDEEGRMMGLTIERGETEFYRATDDATTHLMGEEEDLGIRYGFRLHHTRGGRPYKLPGDWLWFRRKDERAAAIIQHVKRIEDRLAGRRSYASSLVKDGIYIVRGGA